MHMNYKFKQLQNRIVEIGMACRLHVPSSKVPVVGGCLILYTRMNRRLSSIIEGEHLDLHTSSSAAEKAVMVDMVHSC